MKHFNWLVAALLYKHKDERVYNIDLVQIELFLLLN